MSYQPHLHKGGELYHFRTKGSKNGVSNTPGYRAVGKKAVGFLNAAGQYVYNNASKAAGSAGNWLSDRGKQVSKAATNAYRSTREAVTGSNAKKTYQNKKTLADNTSYYNRNRGTVHMDQVRGQKRTQQEQAKIAKQQYDRSLFGRAENAGKAISKAAGSAKKAAGDWLNDRGEDISNTAKKAKKSASKVISGAGKSLDSARKAAGNWLNDRGEDIAKAAGSAKKAASDIRDWATSGGDHQHNARIERARAKSEREFGNYLEGASAKSLNKLGISGKEAREVAQASADRARVHDKKARDEQNKYNKSLAGKFNEAKGVLSGYTKGTRDLIRENGDKWLEGVKPKNIIDRFTGNSYKKSSDSKKSMLNDVDNYLKPEIRKFWKGTSGVKEANYLDNEYGDMRKQVKALDEQYENAPRQKISKAVESAANTAKKAGNAISKTASDAKETASKAISGAGKAAGRAAKTVGNFASTSFSSAKKAVGSGANRAGDFISGLFGKKKPKKASKPTRSKK